MCWSEGNALLRSAELVQAIGSKSGTKAKLQLAKLVAILMETYFGIKTTELPEDLFLQAKRHALEQGTTLKALMEKGLRNALTLPEVINDRPYRFPIISAIQEPVAGQFELDALIDRMRDEYLDQYIK